jgi:hypothetical protein
MESSSSLPMVLLSVPCRLSATIVSQGSDFHDRWGQAEGTLAN